MNEPVFPGASEPLNKRLDLIEAELMSLGRRKIGDDERMAIAEWVIGFLRPQIMKIERSGTDMMVAARKLDSTSGEISTLVDEELAELKRRVAELEQS